MRILIVTPIFPPRTGGPATYVWQLSKRLKQNHQVRIICFSPQPKQLKDVEIIHLPEKGNSLSRQLALAKEVFQNANWAEVVYVQGPLVVGFTSTIATKIKGKKAYLKFVGDEVWEDAGIKGETELALTDFYKSNIGVTNVIKKLIEKASFKLSNKIIVPSNFLKVFLQENFNILAKKIIVINNAVEVDIRRMKKKQNQLIFVGRLVPWKNIDQILKAVKKARLQHPWKLLIVGEGPEEQRLKQLVKTLRAENWTFFKGRLTHQETLTNIAQSEKLILYSSYEGLPHTLIESMLLKTEIIASDIPGNRELVKNFGQLVPLNNITELAKTINHSKRKVEEAKKHAEKTYNWENHSKKLMNIA